ncbi:hypothetical protein CEXT_526981 [Caerostris extrusa]|uniref:Uncharacterized protein n=1 Tax=Caerostris extrusa TaxID=172846 RepID=A0AAV4VB62_CAEEX|nr:hypothetical protein CEXT_526981 [Caerostris extrusa]
MDMESLVFIKSASSRRPSTCSCRQQDDRKHIIYSCTKWSHIRKVYFPPNHHDTKMDLLLFNKKSLQCLRLIIMEIKLKSSIQQSDYSHTWSSSAHLKYKKLSISPSNH